ncbi:MAG: 3-hydroxyacyl-CoA dehydrogenase family protein [Desulfarculaceae bacterium]|nr:3-hydroxyacyl-CoA dehydrogenase family protein [Desulfarculaceae bacterium]MCF8047427.1 3-hydroxyacyl-CoA dehydrogenase family protein [Desulfarculaceae bacterium]MCF8097033.1 3-hydroxyacyl-CoA dehydrogenase family protein [Desulfarculaceae bacterium]MCF8122085.1 3-hydroxyacyl-CoA dehydrogenase family protein [Desulfarculaceae bacterium]
MPEINNITVVGAGLMGHGIAQAFAQKGLAVTLYDLGEDLLTKATASIEENLRTFVEMGLETPDGAARALERISTTTSLPSALESADLALEAAPEILELKQALFADMDRHAPEQAILASNTSMLSISRFGSEVRDPGRLIITHWFNPPHIVPVVEVVMGQGTRQQTKKAVCDLLSRIGKTPVLVNQEIPGFLVNRIQTAMFREVLSLLEMGVASAEDIDRAIMGSFGLRLSVQGVLKTMDLAGLDLMLKGCGYLFGHIAGGTEVPEVLREKVARGQLGAKSGQGFFSYADAAPGAVDAPPGKARDKALLTILKALQEGRA